MPKYIVLLGPPGAGKGTQAQLLSSKLNLVHISSGDIFRENLKAKTPLGLTAQGYINRGELVPDDVTIAMIGERLKQADCKNGALLDGFPRTPAQAEALAKLLPSLGGKVNCVPYISVPASELIQRLSGRWTCPKCNRVYHEIFNPPLVAGKCDDDSTTLYQREDDQRATVEKRIRVYEEQTAPLIDFYRESGLLFVVDGTQPIEKVSDQMLTAIGEVI
jgi:adenylate kinase